MTLSLTLTLPPPPLSVVGGGSVESLLDNVISFTSRKRRIITNASAILNDESKIVSSNPNQNPKATGAAFEEQIIVRFSPPALAKAVRSSVRAGTVDVDLQIDFDKSSFSNTSYFGGPSAPPTASVTFKGQKYRGWLVDLPCLIESQISPNQKQFYKVADISQMLVVDEEDRPQPLREWPHGISPPLSFVRMRRFRRQAAKESLKQVSSEVRRLLEADRQALSVELELIDTPSSTTSATREEEEEDASSVISGPMTATTAGISDEEISELAAEITYDEEETQGGEDEDDREDEEDESMLDEEDTQSTDLIGSGGHFSLLQSRIYSRLSSPGPKESLNQMILSQNYNPSAASSDAPAIADKEFEVYEDEEEMEEESLETRQTELSEPPDTEKEDNDGVEYDGQLQPVEQQDPEDLIDAYAEWLYGGSIYPAT